MKLDRVIISGGGTGGHIFPAIAIADEIKKRNPKAEILFIGAQGKMEMEKVPAAGYRIEGLTIVGFQRKLTFSNFLLPFKIIKSLLKLVQEQNSFPGKTNKLLASKVNVLCTAYDGLDKFFPKEKIRLTGNPVRHDMVSIDWKREEAMNYYGFDSSKKTILIIGGSLGARTLNNALVENIAEIARHDEIQILWQSGKLYYEQMLEIMNKEKVGSIKLVQFIDRMDLAYAAADVGQTKCYSRHRE